MSKGLEKIIFRQLAHVADDLSAAWAPLHGSKILLTGGSGFFGHWILSALNYLQKNSRININCSILSRNPTPIKEKLSFLSESSKYEFLINDIRKFEVNEKNFDYLVHGATTSARETFEGADSLEKFDLLVDGTRNVLRQALDINCKRAIFLSSGVVYGSQNQEIPIKEDDLNAPSTILPNEGLSSGKRAAEFIFSETCRAAGVSFCIARCFSFIGAGLPHDIHYAISNFIVSAINNQDINIISDGKAIRSYLDMRDFIVWLGLLLSQKKDHNLYNIGSSNPITILDLAKLIVQTLSSKSKINILGEVPYAIGNRPRQYYLPSIERFLQDYQPNTEIKLGQAINDYKKSILKS